MSSELLLNYWQEFSLLAWAHILAVASPGPDFAIVLRQSLIYGRRLAVITSVGIGCAILVHVIYAVLGFGLLVKSTPWLFTSIRVLGALYLAYIGLQALRAKASKTAEPSMQNKVQSMTSFSAFRQGFLTNVFNPKATVFFLFLFTSIVSIETPLLVQGFYGLWMAVVTGAWFALLSLMLSSEKIRQFFASFGHWIDRLLGAFLLFLAIAMLASTFS